jgi:hypothetical protein
MAWNLSFLFCASDGEGRAGIASIGDYRFWAIIERQKTPEQKPENLWERACSRWRSIRQHCCAWSSAIASRLAPTVLANRALDIVDPR